MDEKELNNTKKKLGIVYAILIFNFVATVMFAVFCNIPFIGWLLFPQLASLYLFEPYKIMGQLKDLCLSLKFPKLMEVKNEITDK